MPSSPYDLSSNKNLEALKRALRPEPKDYPASPYDLSKRKSRKSTAETTHDRPASPYDLSKRKVR